MRLSQWLIRKSRSWMFSWQMNLGTIGSSFGDGHTLKYFHFTGDFLTLSQRDCQLIHPNYPLRFLKWSQNGQLCTAQYCILIRTSNLASAYFHSHVSSPEDFCSQAIVCHFPMINAVITQTGLIYEEIYMPAEACVSSSAWEMEWELPPAQPEELVFAQQGWRLLAAKGDFFTVGGGVVEAQLLVNRSFDYLLPR